MYKAIGFDLGGVIINYSIPAQLNFLTKELGVPHQAIDKVYHELRPLLDVGTITNQEFWQQLIEKTGSTRSAADTQHFWTDDYISENPFIAGMMNLVETLKKNGYKTGLLSNIDPQHGEINKRRHILEHFDVALFSYEMHSRKPDEEAFAELASKLGVEPNELIFIDDLPENIVGVKKFGAYGIQFQGYEELIKELEMIGIKVD
jgi:epoxide hydrolase-like predicted phosphatase